MVILSIKITVILLYQNDGYSLAETVRFARSAALAARTRSYPLLRCDRCLYGGTLPELNTQQVDLLRFDLQMMLFYILEDYSLHSSYTSQSTAYWFSTQK